MAKQGISYQQNDGNGQGLGSQIVFESSQGFTSGQYTMFVADTRNKIDRTFTKGGSVAIPLLSGNPDRHALIKNQLHLTRGESKDPGLGTNQYGHRHTGLGTIGSDLPTDITGGLTNVSDLDTFGLFDTDLVSGDTLIAGLVGEYISSSGSQSSKLRAAKNKAKEIARQKFQENIGPYASIYVAAQVSSTDIKFPDWIDDYISDAARSLVTYEGIITEAADIETIIRTPYSISSFISTDKGAGQLDDTEVTDEQPYGTEGIETEFNTDKKSADDTDANTVSTGADSTDKAGTDLETKRDSTILSTDSITGLVPSEYTAHDATELPADAETDEKSYEDSDLGTHGTDVSDRDSTDIVTKKHTDYHAETDRDATSLASSLATDEDETKLATGNETDSTNRGHETQHLTILDTDGNLGGLPTDLSGVHTEFGSDLADDTHLIDNTQGTEQVGKPGDGTDVSDRDSTDAGTGKETHVDATYASTGLETDHFSFKQTDQGTSGSDSTKQPGQGRITEAHATNLSTDNETLRPHSTEQNTETLIDSNLSTGAETEQSTVVGTQVSTDQVLIDSTDLISARQTQTDHYSEQQTDHALASTERLSGTDNTDRDSTDMKTHLDDTVHTDFSDVHTNRRTDHLSNLDTDRATHGTDHTYGPMDSTDLNTEDTLGKSDGVHIVYMDTAGYQGSDGKTDLSDLETNIRHDYDSDITTDQATSTDSVTNEDGTSHYGGPTDHKTKDDTGASTYGTQGTAAMETDHKTDKKSEDDTDRSSELGTNNTVFDSTDLASEKETDKNSGADTDNVTHGTSGHTDHKTDKKSEDDTDRASGFGTGGDATDLAGTDRTDHLSFMQTGHATENTRRLGGSDETDRDSTDIDTKVDFNVDDQTDYSGVGTDTDRKMTDSTDLEHGSDDAFSDNHTLSGTDKGSYFDTEHHTHGTVDTEDKTNLATDQLTSVQVSPSTGADIAMNSDDYPAGHTDLSGDHTGNLYSDNHIDLQHTDDSGMHTGYRGSDRANTDHLTGRGSESTNMDTDYATHGTRDTGQVTVLATDESTDHFTDHLTYRQSEQGTYGTAGSDYDGTHHDSTDSATRFNTDKTGATYGASTHEN